MSRVFTLPVAYFARITDFRSYVDATMSLYSIMIIVEILKMHQPPYMLQGYINMAVASPSAGNYKSIIKAFPYSMCIICMHVHPPTTN